MTDCRTPPPGTSVEAAIKMQREQEEETRHAAERTAIDDVLAFYEKALPEVTVRIESTRDCDQSDLTVSILINKEQADLGETEKWLVIADSSGSTTTDAAIGMLSGMTWSETSADQKTPSVRQGGPIYKAVMGLNVYHTMPDDGLRIASERTFTPSDTARL